MSTTTEPFQLKNIYSPALLQNIADLMSEVWPAFPMQAFLTDVFFDGWQALELKERIRHISICLKRHLPADYRVAAEFIAQAAERRIAERGEQLNFEYGFLTDFIEHHGVDDPDFSIPALERITRYTSAEFAVRPFLLRYPDRMFQQMQAWSEHESPYVRRLSSEGFRPRLPWGMGVPALKRDPSPILPVLERLKNDPAETVRRSVANNLNDISKEHPALVLELARRWQGISPETDWVVKHACRSLLKKGDTTALALFGFEKKENHLVVEEFYCSDQVRIGERLEFGCKIRNLEPATYKIRLEYAIAYQTLSGKISRKVFKIKEVNLEAGQVIQLEKYQRFQDFTTRKHFPGIHQISILVNGVALASRDFEVL
jgi:3-methyladenine DNA glycosylase AlkC